MTTPANKITTTQFVQNFQQSASEVWRAIGSFKAYEWGAGVEPGIIEGGRPDNGVGSIRAFRYYGEPARQRLTAHSAAGRTYSWESLEAYQDIRHYELTLTVDALAPVGSSVIWKAAFEAPATRSEYWSAFFRDEFDKSLCKLRTILEAIPGG